MKKFGEQLRRIRMERKMSQEELAELLGTSKQVISRYETGQRYPKITVAIEYAKKLGISLAELGGEQVDPSHPDLIPITESTMRRIPIIGEIAAGQPIFADREYESYIDVDCPSKADVALRIKGDSMLPSFLDGDIVYIREQPDVEDGQVAAVIIDDTATLKHVYHQPNGVLLISENTPKYPPMNITFDDHDCIRILGLVVGFTRMFNNR